mmetsp:Transcript_6792/g.10849  ORF Transcript_6792/g.10849 Transcript_6792/m.10849 type:complete len:264 (+) Transcript_6792:459-1250(+)
MKPIVHIQGHPRNSPRQSRTKEHGRISNIIIVQILFQWCIRFGIINGILDEGLLTRLLTDGRGSAGFKRTSGYGVDAYPPFASGFIGEDFGVGFELGLGRGHTTSVSRDDLLGGNVGKGEHVSALVHDGAEFLEEGDGRVGTGGGGGEVPLTGCFEEGFGDFWAVGEGMDEDVDFAVVGLDGLGGFLDGVAVESSVTFVIFDFLRDVIGRVKDGIERVYLLDDHFAAIGEVGIGVEGALLESALEDSEDWRPCSDDDGGACAG